jgi:recombination protein RecR
MNTITYSSILLENAVNELSRLPGIGRRTALRLALHLLKQPEEVAANLGRSIIQLRSDIKYCNTCHTISDSELCALCANPKRDHTVVCVVEDIRDMLAIENTGQYNGVYHILGGLISPMEGIGPNDLTIAALSQRFVSGNLKELILALPTTVEGDTTNYYLYKILQDTGIEFSAIARGIAIGDELEYTDEVTLGRSILNRMPYTGTFSK